MRVSCLKIDVSAIKIVKISYTGMFLLAVVAVHSLSFSSQGRVKA